MADLASTSVQEITPARAAELLDGAIPGRPLSERQRDLCARDMRLPGWRAEQAVIIVTPGGQLIAGKGVLAAVIEVGLAVPVTVGIAGEDWES